MAIRVIRVILESEQADIVVILDWEYLVIVVIVAIQAIQVILESEQAATAVILDREYLVIAVIVVIVAIQVIRVIAELHQQHYHYHQSQYLDNQDII